jgi:hypothetical protein
METKGLFLLLSLEFEGKSSYPSSSDKHIRLTGYKHISTQPKTLPEKTEIRE